MGTEDKKTNVGPRGRGSGPEDGVAAPRTGYNRLYFNGDELK